MKKPQIIVSVIAVAIAGALFALPKVVVDNEGRDNNLESRQEATDISDNSVNEEGSAAEASANPHAVEMPAELRNKVNTLRESFLDSEKSEKSINFAAELVKAYQSVEYYDSAAWFAGTVADQSDRLEDKKKAGELYYEAFSHALDGSQAQAFGNKAKSYFEQLLETNPQDLEVKNKLAMVYVSTTNPMQGVKMLQEVLDADKDNETAIFNLGLLSIQSGQYKKAVDRFEKLIDLYPENLQAHYWLGVSYFEVGKKRKAKTQFEQVKQMDADPEIQAGADSYLERI